jgi:hypothetical protein
MNHVARRRVTAGVDALRMQRTQRLSELALTQAEIANGIPEVIEQWRETFGS